MPELPRRSNSALSGPLILLAIGVGVLALAFVLVGEWRMASGLWAVGYGLWAGVVALTGKGRE